MVLPSSPGTKTPSPSMGCRPGPTYTVSNVDTVCATAKAHASGAPDSRIACSAGE